MYKKIIPLLCITALLLFGCKNNNNTTQITSRKPVKPIEVKEFGFNLNDYTVVRDTIKSGDNFAEILLKNNIEYRKILEIAEKSKDTFNITKLQAGKPYTLLCSKDSLQIPQCFIYQPNKIDYVVINFKDSIQTYTESKPIKIITKEASGIITSSLSESIDQQGIDYQMVNDLSSIYAWTINFFKLQKGDKFKVVYEEKYINDTIYAGIGNIKATYFEHREKPFYAFNYTTDTINNVNDYYDDEANTLRRAFLQAPLTYSRISSRYTQRRFHPVQKRWKPHLGTDYAAPHGTPILATSNGVVTKSSYTGGNGKYVKIKHNDTYETQYLHMSKRLVKVGEYVKQGDVIGLVGSTGLATGPHVCYRFWKNGKQVDPYKQDLPSAEPIKETLKENYLQFIQPLKEQLDNIPFQEETPKEELITAIN